MELFTFKIITLNQDLYSNSKLNIHDQLNYIHEYQTNTNTTHNCSMFQTLECHLQTV